MERDPIRERIRRRLWEKDLTMRQASLALGRNSAFMHTYLSKGVPKALNHHDGMKLARLLGCDPKELWPSERPKRKSTRSSNQMRRPGNHCAGSAGIAEVEVRIEAGNGSLDGLDNEVRAYWYLPEPMLRQEGGTSPENLRIIRARGESMEPVIGDGDRLLVDISQRNLVTGEMGVIRDEAGLVVRRIETVQTSGPQQLKLIPANPDYGPCTVVAGDACVVGKVVWVVRKV